MSWKADLNLRGWTWEQQLRIWRALPDRIEVLQPFVFKSYERNALVPAEEIALVGDEDEIKQFLQVMVDTAWKAGVRPSGFADHTNELTAVRYHLEDMRALAMSRLPPIISGPNPMESLKII